MNKCSALYLKRGLASPLELGFFSCTKNFDWCWIEVQAFFQYVMFFALTLKFQLWYFTKNLFWVLHLYF